MKIHVLAAIAALTAAVPTVASAQDIGVRIGGGDRGYSERTVVRHARPGVREQSSA